MRVLSDVNGLPVLVGVSVGNTRDNVPVAGSDLWGWAAKVSS
jgi:hypothetical protein